MVEIATATSAASVGSIASMAAAASALSSIASSAAASAAAINLAAGVKTNKAEKAAAAAKKIKAHAAKAKAPLLIKLDRECCFMKKAARPRSPRDKYVPLDSGIGADTETFVLDPLSPRGPAKPAPVSAAGGGALSEDAVASEAGMVPSLQAMTREGAALGEVFEAGAAAGAVEAAVSDGAGIVAAATIGTLRSELTAASSAASAALRAARRGDSGAGGISMFLEMFRTLQFIYTTGSLGTDAQEQFKIISGAFGWASFQV